MPLRLIPPRKGKSPNWTIRGAYLGVRINKSSGANKRPVALTVMRGLERAIETGEYPPRVGPGQGGRTFLTAAVAYMEAGRSPRYVAQLIKHFGPMLITEIDQTAIDEAAVKLFPNVTPGTRNAGIYTPMSAIIRHSGIEIKLRRPKGAKGRVVTDWIRPDDAKGIVQAADGFDAEFGLLLRFLLFTGVRLGEALALTWLDINLPNKRAWIRREKDGIASDIGLRDDLCIRLAEHGPKAAQQKVFRFNQGGNLKHKLTRAKLAYLGLPCPARRPIKWRAPKTRLDWLNFHSFRHTFATWMRRAGVDVQGLVATGNWRDPRSAARYAHVVPREEWARVGELPSVEKTWKTL